MKIYTKENIGEFIEDIEAHYECNGDFPELLYNDGSNVWEKEKYGDLPGAISSLKCGYEVKLELEVKKTTTINATVPAPMDEMPGVDDEYFIVSTAFKNGIKRWIWEGDEADLFYFISGNCFRAEEEAKAYRDAVFPRFKEGE